jgi:hypothetical protein
LAEPFKVSLHAADVQYDSEKSDYLIVENTPEEITAVVSEWFNRSEPYVYSNLQDLFVEKRRQQIEKWLAEDQHFKQYPDQAYRFAARSCHLGTAGKEYLERNWEYGEYLEKMTKAFKENQL